MGRRDPGARADQSRRGRWQVDAPVTQRWTPGEDHWEAGARPPVGVRNFVGTAFDGQQLAVWGGTTAPFVGDVGPYDVLDDGALYDVASDTWHALPPGPPGRTHASLQWSDGRLLLGGGIGTADQRGDYLPDVWAYDPGTDAWEEQPSAPEGGLSGGRWNRYVAGEPSAVTAESQVGHEWATAPVDAGPRRLGAGPVVRRDADG